MFTSPDKAHYLVFEVVQSTATFENCSMTGPFGRYDILNKKCGVSSIKKPWERICNYLISFIIELHRKKYSNIHKKMMTDFVSKKCNITSWTGESG